MKRAALVAVPQSEAQAAVPRGRDRRRSLCGADEWRREPEQGTAVGINERSVIRGVW
jgi:hypothetical protein